MAEKHSLSLISALPRETRRRLVYAVFAISTAILIGAFGFMIIEGFAPIAAFYTATQTVTTVGYGDFTPQTDAGRIFSIMLMLGGGGTVLYALTVVAQAVFQTELLSKLDERRKIKEMNKLEEHFIVCGAGRVGRRIIEELHKVGKDFVVIDRDEKKVESLIEQNYRVIVGDATSEENLRRAGVGKAQGLVACLADDAANVYVVLTARDMNHNLHIVARAVEEQAEPKLIRAGANRVVAPTIIGSHSMARALLKPAIADFMDSIAAENLELAFEEIVVGETSPFIGKMLKDTNIRSELDLVVVAIRRAAGEWQFHPSGETAVLDGDLLIVIGRAETLKTLGRQI